jgi:hypothetical protein
MGANRSGVKRTARMKRAKKMAERLDAKTEAGGQQPQSQVGKSKSAAAGSVEGPRGEKNKK